MSESGQKLMRVHLDRVTSSLMSQVMTWVSVGSQEEFSTIQSKFGHITRVSRGRESPESLITTSDDYDLSLPSSQLKEGPPYGW